MPYIRKYTKKKEDIIGKRFNKLVVIKQVSGKWLCKCDCGKETEVYRTNLMGTKWRKPQISCGCAKGLGNRLINILGQRFGYLEVIEEIKSNSKKKKWLCRCDCGKEKIISGWHLHAGHTKSCGCKRGEAAKQFFAKKREKDWGGRCRGLIHLFKTYKLKAKQRGYCWNLSIEEFETKVNSPCTYCGAPPSSIIDDFIYNGLDRMNNSLGYELFNITTCCGTCNWMKGALNADSFKLQVLKIYNNLYK